MIKDAIEELAQPLKLEIVVDRHKTLGAVGCSWWRERSASGLGFTPSSCSSEENGSPSCASVGARLKVT